jgi:hypothetical protein
MQNNLLITGLLSLLSLTYSGYKQQKKDATNFLSISGPIYVQKKSYQLSWSSHPDASLYKHEYLAAGDQFPNYKSMVMIDFVLTGSTVDQAVATKISQLEKLKATLPIVQFNLIANKATGEKIIDCLMEQTAADDRNSVVERTIYRYKSILTKSGQRGVLLFAVSTREYGKGITPFLVRLKTDKPILVNEVAKLSLPEINIKR